MPTSSEPKWFHDRFSITRRSGAVVSGLVLYALLAPPLAFVLAPAWIAASKPPLPSWPETMAEWGDALGGIATAVGILFIWRQLWLQNKAHALAEAQHALDTAMYLEVVLEQSNQGPSSGELVLENRGAKGEILNMTILSAVRFSCPGWSDPTEYVELGAKSLVQKRWIQGGGSIRIANFYRQSGYADPYHGLHKTKGRGMKIDQALKWIETFEYHYELFYNDGSGTFIIPKLTIEEEDDDEHPDPDALYRLGLRYSHSLQTLSWLTTSDLGFDMNKAFGDCRRALEELKANQSDLMSADWCEDRRKQMPVLIALQARQQTTEKFAKYWVLRDGQLVEIDDTQMGMKQVRRCLTELLVLGALSLAHFNDPWLEGTLRFILNDAGGE